MKKLFAFLLICSIPVLSFGAPGHSFWKGIFRKNRAPAQGQVRRVGNFAPHGYISQITRKIGQRAKEKQPTVHPVISALFKERYPQITPKLPENFFEEIPSIAQRTNKLCLLESQLPYLYLTDTNSIFFERLGATDDIVVVRLRRNLDVFDPGSQKFYTLKKSSTLNMQISQLLELRNQLQLDDTNTVQAKASDLQTIASASSGARSFLFQEELFPLALSLDNKVLGEPFIAASQAEPGYEIGVNLKKPLFVFSKEKQSFVPFSEGSYLFFTSDGQNVSHASGVPTALTKETLLNLVANDTNHVFFEEPFAIRSLLDGRMHQVYRANFKITIEGTSQWTPKFIPAGDYLVLDPEKGSFQILKGDSKFVPAGNSLVLDQGQQSFTTL